jgi:peptide/nickel transport system permease protein
MWKKLFKNPLATCGALILIIFYLVAIAADFVAPYHPYEQQPDGSLLPPTSIYTVNQQGENIGFHIYPTTQGPTDINTGDRRLIIDYKQPTKIAFFVPGYEYKILGIIPTKLHLFGTLGPAKINLLGTDDQARDEFSRLIHGARISLSIGILGIIISFPLGMLIGGISGYFGGLVDVTIMRFTEVIMTIPSIYLLVALAAVLPPGLNSVQKFGLIVLITSFIRWAGLARVIRGQVLSIKELEFVQAAKAMGANSFSIIINHILPQTSTYIIISATLAVPDFILSEAVLSFIGLGIQQPEPSWGNMLNLASNASILIFQPWLVFAPVIVMISTVLAFNLLGDGLRDALDPRSLKR